MLNTAVNSAFGLLYWIVAARAFSPEDVGRGSALISLMVLVSTLTQLDLGQALIRFLPRAGTTAARLVRGAYGLSVALATGGAAVAMAWCAVVADPGDPLHVSLPFAAWFVVSTAAWSVFSLQDAALTGVQSAVWVTVTNGAYGLVKLVLLIVVARTSVTDGVFTAWTLPVLALLAPVNLLLFRRLLPRHAAATAAITRRPTRRVLAGYVAGGYAGQLAGQLSSTFLPVLVVALLGAAQGAFFLPAQTAFTALHLLTQSVTSSLVVEAAKDEDNAPAYAAAVLRRTGLTVLPAAVLIGVCAPWLLALFGPEYRAHATFVLQLLMAAVLPRVLVSLAIARARLQNRTGRIALLQSFQAAALIGGTALLAGPLGLAAVGWSALGGELLRVLAVGPGLVRWLAGRDQADVPDEHEIAHEGLDGARRGTAE
jgi:O-antigen/teichoic acid export membrane protein